MSVPILSASQIAKSFGSNVVLSDVSVEVYPGEVLALLGENGAGKSTFVNILSGSLQASGGSVSFAGRPVHFHSVREALASGIVHIHQELSNFSSLSVMENLFIGDYLTGRSGIINRKRLATQARNLLSQINVTHIDPRTEAGRLSVAEQQMVEIAKALAHKARLLILDEPTASLTLHEAGALFQVIDMLKKRGVGIIFISHRLDEVFSVADRVVVLRDGRVISTSQKDEVTQQTVIADMTGRAFQGFKRNSVASTGKTVLEVDRLTDGKKVGPVNFSLRAGEVLGIFGLVGSGRTELLELLVGARQIADGEVRRKGEHSQFSSPRDALRNGFALLPEGRKTNGILPDLSVFENICVSSRQKNGRTFLSQNERKTALDHKADLGIVTADIAQAIQKLSGGNQQKTLLARCLAVGPSILLLDEPTHGVDIRTKAEIYQRIQHLAEQGVAIVFVSSELPEVLALASTIMVMSNGRSTFYEPNTGLSENDVLAAAFARHEVIDL